jgi:hypothetical protein
MLLDDFLEPDDAPDADLDHAAIEDESLVLDDEDEAGMSGGDLGLTPPD